MTSIGINWVQNGKTFKSAFTCNSKIFKFLCLRTVFIYQNMNLQIRTCLRLLLLPDLWISMLLFWRLGRSNREPQSLQSSHICIQIKREMGIFLLSSQLLKLPRGSSRSPLSKIVNTPTIWWPSLVRSLKSSAANVLCPMRAILNDLVGAWNFFCE